MQKHFKGNSLMLLKRCSTLTLSKPNDIVCKIAHLTRSNKIEEASNLYEVAKHQGFRSINLYSQGIQISLKQRNFSKAWDLLKEYRLNYGFPDTVIYTQMIQAAAMQNNAERALNLFSEMQSNGFSVNERTYLALMQAVANRQDHAHQIFDISERMQSQGFKLNPNHYINLIGACGKLRLIGRAKDYWNMIINKEHNVHQKLYRKLMWAYYFSFSDLLHLKNLKDRNSLTKYLKNSDNIQASMFVSTKHIEIADLLQEVYTLKQQFGVTDPFIKILCMLDEKKALECIVTMNETMLIEMLKSCSLFGNVQMAMELVQKHKINTNKVKIELIHCMAKNNYVTEALELMMEFPNPRINDFKSLYNACYENLELLQVFSECFKHPLDYNLKLRIDRRIQKLISKND
eukprot:NODE_404_length_9277_cov_0.359407.p1 type:complete len:403 gc:universal NODE_404_length_9277_cov_0.359407:7793-9001(+)